MLEAKGVKVNTLSPEAFEAFRKATRPAYKEFRSKIGPEFMDASMKFIEDYRRNN
jgi:TRAP-type C4-dicarboxylate transport system substrate-binding protein